MVLAKDLREQLDQVKDAGDQAKLAGGIQVLLTQLAEVSDNAGMLDWAGLTMLQLATGLSENSGSKAVVKELNAGAVKVFTKMLDAEQKNKGFLDAIQRKPEDVQIRQALAYRGQADYAKASDVLLDILKEQYTTDGSNRSAKNFQEWAAGKDVEKLKKALFGSEPGPKGKNIIWGWGQMSKMLSSQMGNRQDLQSVFFDARLQLAACRRLIGLTFPAGPERQKDLERALADIKQTHSIYPDLGNPASKKAFDDLAKKVQSDLGKPPSVCRNSFKPKPPLRLPPPIEKAN